MRTTPPDEPSQPALSNESSLQGPRHGEIQISNLSWDLSEYMATKINENNKMFVALVITFGNK